MDKKELSVYILVILMAILLVIIICLVSVQTYKLNYNDVNVTKILTNLDSSPIYSLSLEQKDGCQSKGGITKIIYTYPSTYTGESCYYGTGKICEGNICRKCYNSKHSRTIDAMSPYDVKLWRERELCQLDSEKFDKYKNILSSTVENEQNCPDGQKGCGIIDSFNRTLCIDQNDECPINYLAIGPCSSNPEGLPNNFTSLPFNDSDETCLFYSKENYEGKIIANFEVSEIDNVCYYLSEKATTRKLHPLEKLSEDDCKKSFKGNQYDDRYTKIDKVTISSFYSHSGLGEYLEKMDGFSSLYYADLERYASLFTSNFFGVDKKNIENTFNQVQNIETNLKKAKKLYKPTFIIIVILIVLDTCASYCILPAIPILFLVVNLLLLIPCLVLESLTTSYYSKISNINSVFDENINENLSDILKSIKKFRDYSISIVSMITLYIASSIMVTLLVFCKDKIESIRLRRRYTAKEKVIQRIRTVKTLFGKGDPAPPGNATPNNNENNDNNQQIAKPIAPINNDNPGNGNNQEAPPVQNNEEINNQNSPGQEGDQQQIHDVNALKENNANSNFENVVNPVEVKDKNDYDQNIGPNVNKDNINEHKEQGSGYMNIANQLDG